MAGYAGPTGGYSLIGIESDGDNTYAVVRGQLRAEGIGTYRDPIDFPWEPYRSDGRLNITLRDVVDGYSDKANLLACHCHREGVGMQEKVSVFKYRGAFKIVTARGVGYILHAGRISRSVR